MELRDKFYQDLGIKKEEISADNIVPMSKLENGLLYVNGTEIPDADFWKFLFKDSPIYKNFSSIKSRVAKEEQNKLKKELTKEALKSSQFDLPTYFGNPENVPVRFYPLDAEMSSFNVYVVRDFQTKTLALKLKAYGLTGDNNVLALLIDQDENLVRAYFDETYKRYCKALEEKGLESKIVGFTDFLKNALSKQLPLCHDLVISEEPAILTDNKDEWNLCCINKEAYKSIDKDKLSVWYDWLNKIPTKEHRKAFCAWVGSIFDSQNKNRNMLFLVGQGQTGKSAAANAIYEKLKDYIPTGVAAFSTENVEPRWLNSVAMGKRFMMYPDCSDLHILSNQVLKTITGNDFARVEYKNKQEFTSRLYSKIMIVSNFYPYCSYKSAHEYSRYLLIPISQYRSNEYGSLNAIEYQQKLSDGVEDFLKLCYSVYVREGRPSEFCAEGSFCHTHAKNVTTDLTNAAADKFIKANCEMGKAPGYYINKNSLISFLFRFFKADHITPANQKRLVHETLPDIINKDGLDQVRLKDGETYIIGIKVNNPSQITSLEEVLSGSDKKETLYSIEDNNIPDNLAEEYRNILRQQSNTRHYD